MKSELFPNTLQSVLSQKKQFSTWRNRNIAKPTDKVYKNIDQVLSGKTNVLCPSFLYFKTKSPHYPSGSLKIGDHYFSQQPK